MARENKYKVEYLASNPKTADGYPIADGMAVWDYNLRPGYVSLDRLDDLGWFHVLDMDGNRSLMNWERICVRHPHSWLKASDVLAEMEKNDRLFKSEIQDVN